LTIEMLEPRVDEQSLKAAKDPLTKGESLQDGGRMALVIIDPNAVERSGENNEFGGFQIFTRPKLDDRVVDLIRDQVRSAIRTTRITAAGYSPDEFDALNSVVQRRTQEVTATGEERGALGELNMLLQFAFMFLMMMSVFVSGQYLLTTTIEEKSSRVVELLLSSASPMSLMAGKIFGQMGVGLFLIMVYGSLGFVGLLIASMVDIISPMMIVWFFCFYSVAYTIIASLMAAVGSAVNDLREAQSLMTPVMMIIMLPYILWLPISRDPNSTFATIASFIPGVNPFVLILRLTSTEPPPTWQVAVGLIIGIASAYAAVWVAAKVFRVGLLMFGKPPSYATLWRWIRMA
ncbi:MAG: ABC transporter permease, partial [Planctomycetota bacterium]